MRKLLLPLIFLILLPGEEAKGTHLYGAEMWYECLNQCTIRVHVTTYRDCGGINQMNFWNFQWEAASNCTNPSPVSNWIPGSSNLSNSFYITEITALCPSAQSQCTNQNVNVRGIEEWHRYRDYNVCNLNCASYDLVYNNQARNPSITTIPQIGGMDQSLGLFSLQFDTSGTYCNSSPVFNALRGAPLCAGQKNYIASGATDPEGDSLAYRLGKCYQRNGNQIVYNVGYSRNQPLGSGWDVEIDELTGVISFDPKPGQIEIGVICVIAEEWRNGIKINEISRDIQLNMEICQNQGPNIQSQYLSTVYTDSSGATVTCEDSFRIQLLSTPRNYQQHLYLKDSVPYAYLRNLSGKKVDTISGLNPTGVLVILRDSLNGMSNFRIDLAGEVCPYQLIYSEVFRVNNYACSCPDIQVSRQCDTVVFGVSGHQNAQINWSGDGGLDSNLNNTDSIFSHVYPNPPAVWSFQLQLVDTITGCPIVYKDSVSTLRTKIQFNQGDAVQCDTLPYTFGPYPLASTYNWSDGGTASTYAVSDGDSIWVNGLDTNGCLYFSDTVVFHADTLNLNILGDSIICAEPQTMLWSSEVMQQYLWSTGDTTDSIAVTQTTTVQLTAWNTHGCEFTSKKLQVSTIDKPLNLDFTSLVTIDSITAWAWQLPNDSLIKSYEWILGNGDTAYGDTIWYKYDSAAIYNLCLRIYYEDSCSFEKCRNIILNRNDFSAARDMEYFPNPVSQTLNIQNNFRNKLKLRLLSVQGHRILSRSCKPGLTKLDVSGIPEGMYILEYSGVQGGVFREKIILVRK